MNILITSAGRRSYLIKYFKEALSDEGKVYASNSVYTISLQEADDYTITPLVYDSNYIEFIIDYCLKNSIKAIISVFDIDLLVLSKAKAQIESQGIKLLLSADDVVSICNDKWLTYKFLQENNIKTPITFKDKNSLITALDNGKIGFPIIMKPRWGMASMGIYIVDDIEELEFYYKRILKEISQSYLKYESSLTPYEMVLFQEVIKGQEYGLDIINDLNGNYVGVFPKSKLLMRAGETDLGQTVSPLQFEKLARTISDTLKHEVILSVDCFNFEGENYVIEMNCRISGHYPLSHLAGVNLPKQIIEWLQGKETNLNYFNFEENLFITKDLTPIILNYNK